MRVFLACPVPEQAAALLADWASRELDPEAVRIIPADNLHVTLAFFGEVAPETAEELSSLTRRVVWKPQEVVVSGAKLYGRNAIAVRVLGLFAQPMDHELAELWLSQPESQRHRDPDPHVTVARLRPRAPAPELPHPPQIAFTLDRLVLFQSILSAEGSTYEELAEAREAGA